ncbi:MAG: Asp-tRNA(Asn)/Glu-tRNA(Gln) amidotransferase subunit GatC [Verrucomicrobia bacterium]|nr:Asp-tRNA(Asn)/Glu-tRNA(Gln) amidotransferase subunit GatC [Verrucomicrobiota bacterium]
MDLDETALKKLSKLCRIECTEEEAKELGAKLSTVLKYIALLDEVDTTHVTHCNRVNETQANVMREDVTGDLLPRETFLANAPSHVGGMIRVPPVIKFNP